MKNDVMDTSNVYSYEIDLSKFKLDLPKEPKKQKVAAKRYICIDLEMTEFTASQRICIPGVNGEVIQFGAVMLDENYNLLSEFSSYVKPAYSSVTPLINQLTGISNQNLEKADDFLTVFDKFCYWRGEGDITTFCWSQVDFNQLWSELEAKGKHRYDLFNVLHDFVDLQKVFGNLISSKKAVGLESAMRFLQMDYKGQIHTALSDSYNTARIFHKLFCTKSLDLDFEYINPSKECTINQKEEAEYSCSLASFLSPELLAQFGYSDSEDEVETEDYTDEAATDDLQILKDSPLAGMVNDEEIAGLCSKYKINIQSWLKLATEVMETEEMQVA
ncbi:MAG: exonuclease domain-containing protein [Treponema sp.]|nr:exonuclease domain-containing protein [Treponema sp.]